MDTEIFPHPKYPIFEYEDDPICRSLLAAGIGNDYFIGGQGKYGIAAASKTISAIKHINNDDDRFIEEKIVTTSIKENWRTKKKTSKMAAYGNHFLKSYL